MKFLLGTLALALAGLFTLFICFVLICFSLFFPSRRKWQDSIILFWAKTCLFLSHSQISIYGRENLPQEGALFLFNHLSLFDIPALHIAVPKIRLGAKSELFNIPIFGFALRKVGVLFIVRGDSKKTIELYKASIKRVQKGESFALAPEGTRQDGKKIRPFKRGPFIFALEGKLLLVPVVLIGTEKLLPKKRLYLDLSFRRKQIELHILPSIQTQDLGIKDLNTLRLDVQKKMSDFYDQKISSKT